MPAAAAATRWHPVDLDVVATEVRPVKIDVFNHIFPKEYFAKITSVMPEPVDMHKRVRSIPTLVDLDARFRIMDRFDDYVQVISLAGPPVDEFGPPALASQLARLANDGLAELVHRYGDRFVGFVASLPMTDPDAMMREAERALRELGAVGVQVYTNILGRPLVNDDTMPLFDLMAQVDRPIWLHPIRGADFPDYKTERKSHYEIWWVFGWPYETSAAMAHMVFAGLFDRHPNLKVITHHMGGMVPYFAGRVAGWDQLGVRTTDEDYRPLLQRLRHRPQDYFRMFYADTALFGARDATLCGLRFFGPERTLFATDMPFDPEHGARFVRSTIEVIESLDLTDEERYAVYEGNARRLLGWPAR